MCYIRNIHGEKEYYNDSDKKFDKLYNLFIEPIKNKKLIDSWKK
jgi:hypothetical protein